MIINGSYDVIVVGGGHAGCEAALAAARMGVSVLMLNLYLDNTALMPCNPSIGGPAKGHLAREIDALGGEMALAADSSTRHLRWLNTSKGPAVRTLRAQCDPRAYGDHYRAALLAEPNLKLHQALAVELLVRHGRAVGVKIRTGEAFYAKTVILATGTYLSSKVFVGLVSHKSGPLGMVSSGELARSLRGTGLELGRLRTDTTPRLQADTIDWERLDTQRSLPEPAAFSHFSEKKTYRGVVCGLTRTNPGTHEAIRRWFGSSPLFQGTLETEGPRYCPSIDDKIIKFPEKESHPIFLEPVSRWNQEVYMQNFSTSMCLEAQIEAVATIQGCEKAHILRPGYAIEYDFVQPTQLEPWLETKPVKNLFLAGQINGTSGYEEAGAQGLIAGANAALRVREDAPFVLRRDESYIGVLIDDLVTKGTKEPYRMLTSRCEYRLILRHDNADTRLADKGHGIGLLNDIKMSVLTGRRHSMKDEKKRISSVKISPAESVNAKLAERGSSVISEKIPALELLRRPEVGWDIIAELTGSKIDSELGERISVELKYEGYIERQNRRVEKFRRMENLRFPGDFDFASVGGLSAEGRQKLLRVLPRTLGQASRVSGVTPVDIQLLWVTLEQRRRERKNAGDGQGSQSADR